MAVVTLGDTHGLVTRPTARLWASSEGLGWRSMFATAQRETPFHAQCRAVADPLVVVHLSGPVRVTRMLAGKHESCLVPPGGVFVMPGGVEFGVVLEAPLDTVHFYLHRDIVDEIAAEFAGSEDQLRIVPNFGGVDPLLEQIALTLREQLHEAGRAAALYVDHIARMAAARLLRAHSSGALRSKSPRQAGLGAARLERAIGYIEANLEKDPTLPELAAVAGLSPIYFARQFKRATGLAPHQFLLRARVERAKRLLAAGDMPIAAIALDCGFCHQEHLTRVFRKQCGMTPGAYRASCRS